MAAQCGAMQERREAERERHARDAERRSDRFSRLRGARGCVDPFRVSAEHTQGWVHPLSRLRGHGACVGRCSAPRARADGSSFPVICLTQGNTTRSRVQGKQGENDAQIGHLTYTQVRARTGKGTRTGTCTCTGTRARACTRAPVCNHAHS